MSAEETARRTAESIAKFTSLGQADMAANAINQIVDMVGQLESSVHTHSGITADMRGLAKDRADIIRSLARVRASSDRDYRHKIEQILYTHVRPDMDHKARVRIARDRKRSGFIQGFRKLFTMS